MNKFSYRSLLTIIIITLLCGCGTVRRAAVNQVTDALSGEKTMMVIASDNDPDLIWDAMPFALKTMEVMHAQDPTNARLCLTTSNGYVQYACGYLFQEAQKHEDVDYQKAQHLWKRAYKLNIRGRGLCSNGS